MVNKTKTIKRLKKVYDQVPDVECKGLCHRQCSMIPVEPCEQDVIMDISGAFQHNPRIGIAHGDRVLPLSPQGQCGYLDAFKKCAVYENRPLICRLYGAAEGLECEHGCKPKRYLDRDEVVKLLRKVQKI